MKQKDSRITEKNKEKGKKINMKAQENKDEK